MKGGDHKYLITHVLDSMNEVITNNYDQDHQAIDIVPKDKSEPNIIALDGGTVEKVINNVKSTNHKSKGLATYGNYVQIKQNNGKTALYAHMKYNTIKVKEGQTINKGDVIGTIGETGNAYGKHLHLEIKNQNKTKENPLIELNKKTQYTSKKTSTKTTIKKPSTQTKQSNYLSASNYHHGSIVDGLKSIGVNSSYSYRKKLAENNGITNYKGSYQQNIKMLKLLKNGLLKKV